MKRNIFRIILLVLAICGFSLILSGGAIFYFLFTKSGGSFLSRQLFRVVDTHGRAISWQENEGSLISGMTYNDVVIKDLEWFPFPNELKIQKIVMHISSLSLDGLVLHIENARLLLPDADLISFRGKLEKGTLDFNVYTNSIYDEEIKGFLKSDFLRNVRGRLTGVDVFVGGTIEEPVIKGAFIVEKISKDGFTLEQAPCTFEISLRKHPGGVGLHGPLVLQKGTISGKKTALLELQESKLFFRGDPGKPAFDIKATSVVEKIRMRIAIQGDFANPDLQVSSNPPLSRERILLALATNQTWRGTDEILSGGGASLDLARDFIDYFVFGGKGNKFAEKFGLRNVSVKYDDQGKGVAVTKGLSERLEGTYEIEEKRKEEGTPDVSQKISGEYKITDTISLEGQKELRQRDPERPQEEVATDDKLLLRFKTSF